MLLFQHIILTILILSPKEVLITVDQMFHLLDVRVCQEVGWLRTRRSLPVKPGDIVTIKDTKIHVLIHMTEPVLLQEVGEDLDGICPIWRKAVNYLFEFPAGTFITLVIHTIVFVIAKLVT